MEGNENKTSRSLILLFPLTRFDNSFHKTTLIHKRTHKIFIGIGHYHHYHYYKEV